MSNRVIQSTGSDAAQHPATPESQATTARTESAASGEVAALDYLPAPFRPDPAGASLLRRLAPPQQRQTLLALQRTHGNAGMQRLLGQRRPTTGSLTNVVGQEDGLATATAPADVLVDVLETEPDQVATAAPEGDRSVGMTADHGLLLKASIAVQAGAKPSYRLKSNEYGATTPQHVAVEITARLDKKAGTWSPKVTRLIGHYAMQARLLPKQTEITGPGGNSTKKNFCDQAANLLLLGTTSSKWYMLNAVIRHEKVHVMRLLPALKAAASAIKTRIEKAMIRHDGKMTQAEAIARLQAPKPYKDEVKYARKLWLAKLKPLSSGDHASDGPTERAEQRVTEPMRKKICDFAKKMKWGNCPGCRRLGR